jgi:hypothetical protein
MLREIAEALLALEAVTATLTIVLLGVDSRRRA